jgi:hypothetical protein
MAKAVRISTRETASEIENRASILDLILSDSFSRVLKYN